MVYFCGVVVSFGGVSLGAEIAEICSFVVVAYCGAPFSFLLVEADTFEFRGAEPWSCVPGVLGVCRESEVRTTIVEAVSVDVVDAVAWRGGDEAAVHKEA